MDITTSFVPDLGEWIANINFENGLEFSVRYKDNKTEFLRWSNEGDISFIDFKDIEKAVKSAVDALKEIEPR
jgi:hypothetical protein